MLGHPDELPGTRISLANPLPTRGMNSGGFSATRWTETLGIPGYSRLSHTTWTATDRQFPGHLSIPTTELDGLLGGWSAGILGCRVQSTLTARNPGHTRASITRSAVTVIRQIEQEPGLELRVAGRLEQSGFVQLHALEHHSLGEVGAEPGIDGAPA